MVYDIILHQRIFFKEVAFSSSAVKISYIYLIYKNDEHDAKKPTGRHKVTHLFH